MVCGLSFLLSAQVPVKEQQGRVLKARHRGTQHTFGVLALVVVCCGRSRDPGVRKHGAR